MAFIYMSNGLVVQVSTTREALAQVLAKAPAKRPLEYDAEGFKPGNQTVKVTLNPDEIVAVSDEPLTPQR